MSQRNVIASFDDYDEANQASQELIRAGLGDVQVRIVPPPSMRRSAMQRVIVSAIVSGDHARMAESVLARHGSVDLAEDVHWGSRRDSMNRGFGGRARVRNSERNREKELPWGAIAGAAVAIVTGFAFMRGARMFGEAEQHSSSHQQWPGRLQQRRDYVPPSASASYPDGPEMRRTLRQDRRTSQSARSSAMSGSASPIVDPADREALAGSTSVRQPSATGHATRGAGLFSETETGAGAAQTGRSTPGAASRERRGTHVGSTIGT